MKQSEAIYRFNDHARPKFNDELFTRSDDDIINALKNVILSCERDSTFTIKVLDFEVIEGYDEINYILYKYQSAIINKKNPQEEIENGTEPTEIQNNNSSSKKKKDNQFDYINLKDSDIKLIKVTYFIQIVEKKDGLVNDTVVVYIAIPRIVDKYYFRLNGNIYSAMYQIVDASTYNNTASNSAKKQTITFKNVFTPIRVYRYFTNIINDKGEAIKCAYFMTGLFKKLVFTMKYLLAKMGFVNTLSFLHLSEIFLLEEKDLHLIDRSYNHIFPIRDGMYITIPKMLFDKSYVAQSIVYTIYYVLTNNTNITYQEVFDIKTWLKSLGSDFVTKEIDTLDIKGQYILASLEFVYDKTTQEDLKLDMEDKADIYRVLRWIIYEFNTLRLKDNMDVSTKKISIDYIAALYAARIAYGIYRLSDKADKADLKTIRDAIQIPPMFLINAIIRCQLVNYKNCVNDIDSITALKFTYKGVSGIGEKSNAIPNDYKQIHPSYIGRLDLDSSSASDPGVSGTICPLSSYHDHHFTEFKEPSTWESELYKLIDQLNSMNSKKEMARLIKKENLSVKPISDNTAIINECIGINKTIAGFAMDIENRSEVISGYDIFGDGYLYFSKE